MVFYSPYRQKLEQQLKTGHKCFQILPNLSFEFSHLIPQKLCSKESTIKHIKKQYVLYFRCSIYKWLKLKITKTTNLKYHSNEILQHITLKIIIDEAEECLITFHMFRLYYLSFHFTSPVLLSISHSYSFYYDLIIVYFPKTNK